MPNFTQERMDALTVNDAMISTFSFSLQGHLGEYRLPYGPLTAAEVATGDGPGCHALRHEVRQVLESDDESFYSLEFCFMANDGGESDDDADVEELEITVDLPDTLDLPLGALRFVVGATAIAASDLLSLYVDDNLPVNGYGTQNDAGEWVNLAYADEERGMVRNPDRICLDILFEDGGEFDAGGEVNGIIVNEGISGYCFGEGFSETGEGILHLCQALLQAASGQDFLVDFEVIVEAGASLEDLAAMLESTEIFQCRNYGSGQQMSDALVDGDFLRPRELCLTGVPPEVVGEGA
ncbi:choice-of-anchor U domain-containing protein [Trichloromonas sp.]|uniref:choice-of-anchor U domain-containing protein n=1 Tax=Trichloromonas sp. TaxID=3069249 RepID=UPI002A44893A|nr:choice-of-anchor U domain-containing protein [Trichloromonas sp.]